jgi:GTP-binding protein
MILLGSLASTKEEKHTMQLRNIAIIAHVDHGKTTMVDGMLKQTHTFRDNQAEMSQTTILDSNDQERERGITILAKNTAVMYHDTKINIIDTPGHADFSGEVERIINMADGAVLIVDAAEGVLPQTFFVLQKALEQNLKVIVVINKIDRGDARHEEVLSEVEDLFLRLATDEAHLHFPVIYAIGRDGKAWSEYPSDMTAEADLTPLFEEIIRTVPAPEVEADKPFKMLVSTLDFDAYKGTYAIGKVKQGKVRTGQPVLRLLENEQLGQFRVQQVFTSMGLSRTEVAESMPGDIIAITGMQDIHIGETIADPADPIGYPAIKLTEPTLKINIAPNTSPMSGREGEFGTARQIEERLNREKRTNIGLRIESNPTGQGFLVYGRGELHLSVLIENLRREGFELEVGKPEVLLKEIDGVKSEPYEEMTIEIDQSYAGAVIEEMGKRRGEMTDTSTNDQGITRMVYKISSRNLLGFRSVMLTKTRGNGLFASQSIGYGPVGPVAPQSRNGVLVAFEAGTATKYSLENLQERGTSFINPGDEVYEGMIIGLNSRQEDMDLNIAKEKKLTNMRSSNADIGIVLDQPTIMSLEQALDFLEDDELLEVTPKSLRLRKKMLNKLERARSRKQ